MYGFDSAERWLAVYRNYEAYAVTGMKLKFIPTNLRGNVSHYSEGTFANGTGQIDAYHKTSILGTQFLWYDIDTYDTTNYTLPQITGLDKSWCYDPTRTWKRWFGARALSKAQNVSWQDTATYAQNQANALTNASVALNQPFKGMGTGSVADTFGYIKVVWYVTFKGQAYLN